MEVLNKTERRKSFLFFLVFFCLTMGLLLIAVFFNVAFPFVENQLLKKENQKMKQEMEIQNRFSFQLEQVKGAVDSIGIAGQNDYFNEKLALSVLADMYKQLPKDSLQNKTMYNNTIMTYKSLIDAKKEIKHLSMNRETMDSLSSLNKALKEEYDKMKTDLEVCRQIYQSQ